MRLEHFWRCPVCRYEIPPGTYADVKTEQREHLAEDHPGKQLLRWQLQIASGPIFKEDV